MKPNYFMKTEGGEMGSSEPSLDLLMHRVYQDLFLT